MKKKLAVEVDVYEFAEEAEVKLKKEKTKKKDEKE